MACSLLRDGHEAEDVVQEVFMRFWQQGANVEKPRNWLMRVAHNLSIDRLRVAGRFIESDEEVLIDDSGGDSDPEWNYRQGELSARLERAIDTLPGIQRSLVVLYDMRGMSGKDCAEILGISVNQVKVYLHRARRRLREKLERPDG